MKKWKPLNKFLKDQIKHFKFLNIINSFITNNVDVYSEPNHVINTFRQSHRRSVIEFFFGKGDTDQLGCKR